MTIRRVPVPAHIRHPAQVAEWLASGGAGASIPSGYEPSRAIDPDRDDEFSQLESGPAPERPREPEEEEAPALPPAAVRRAPAPPVIQDPKLTILAFGKSDIADFTSCRVTLTDAERKAVRQILIRAYKRHQREVVSRLEGEA